MRPNHIYHLFPLGCLKDGQGNYRNIKHLETIIPHLQELRLDSVLLGPIFRSETHGYDVTDMYQLDPRLGNNEDLKKMVRTFHSAGFQVFFDAVWNHSSRHHFAYRDLREKGRNSPYAHWYRNIQFDKPNLCGDSFTVDCWAGFQELPAFNLKNPEVEQELIHCAEFWMDQFNIDGIRIDAAQEMDLEFLNHLATACHSKRPHFWMMGEVVFGDPSKWLKAGLDSVTNYQTYKALWSSLNDNNLFELAYNLNQFFDDQKGTCKGKRLQLFNENHDVSRIYSTLKNKEDNFLLHLLFYTLPGVPTLYYGEEYAFDAIKGGSDDWNLRPSLNTLEDKNFTNQKNLLFEICRLAGLRLDCDALRDGGYKQEIVQSQQLAFWRTHPKGDALVFANAQKDIVQYEINLQNHAETLWTDLLNPAETFTAKNGNLTIKIPAKWGRILVPKGIL